MGSEVTQDGVSTLDGIDGRLELVVDQIFVSIVFSKSLRSQTSKDLLDAGDVVVSLFQISLGSSQSILASSGSSVSSVKSILGIVDFVLSELEFLGAFSILFLG